MSILFNVFIFGIVAGCLYMLYKQDKYISELITDIDELQEINDTQAGTIRKMMDDVFIHDDAYSDLKEDFLLLAESVDMFLEENDNDTLSDVVSVMDELSDKYSSLKQTVSQITLMSLKNMCHVMNVTTPVVFVTQLQNRKL